MKFLIWFGCLLVLSVVQTALRMAGVSLGGIPTVILSSLLLFIPAPILCRKWDDRKMRKEAIKEIQENTETGGQYTPVIGEPVKISERDSTQAEADVAAEEMMKVKPVNGESLTPEIAFCRKCGAKLIPGSEFCSKCGTAILKKDCSN